MAGTFFIHCGVVKSIQSFIYNRSIRVNCIADLIKLASEKKKKYIYIHVHAKTVSRGHGNGSKANMGRCQAHVYLHLVTYG